jgi:hypothetical protein
MLINMQQSASHTRDPDRLASLGLGALRVRGVGTVAQTGAGGVSQTVAMIAFLVVRALN